jgi:hypothetical protein
MGEQGGSHKADGQRRNDSGENAGIGPARGSPESDPGLVNEQMRKKQNQLNNANENGNSGSQGWCSSASEAAIALEY